VARQLLELPEYRYANAREKDPLPEYYVESQAQHIIQYLSAVVPAGDGAVRLSWKEVRDRTAVALMLGGGLAPGDIRAATIGGLNTSGGPTPGVPWKISLPGNGNAPARETPIAAWTGALLRYWVEVRTDQGIPGDVLLPSTLSGKALSHAACYKVCKAVLAAAGMDGDNGGIFKLRHTFALRQLADGKSEVDVARWLGLVDLNGMARYRKVVTQPVNLV
jgi:integrase